MKFDSVEIEWIHNYIAEHIEYNSVHIKEDISAHFDMSASRLEQCYKDATNQPLGNYMRFARLEIGKQLIEQGKWWEIVSYMVGYGTPEGFRTAFKREYGLLPSEYDEKLRPESSAKSKKKVAVDSPYDKYSIRKTCKGCIHRRLMTGACSYACHYSIDTDQLRNCSAENCPYYNNNSADLAKYLKQSLFPRQRHDYY
jgi:AraC-like DNA-binding protein